jgi:hypothetical protein
LQKKIERIATAKAEEVGAKTALINKQAGLIGDVMRFFLRNKPLTTEAREFILARGMPEADLDAELQRREHETT